MAIELIVAANAAGARLVSACCELGISLRTVKRWRRAFGGDGNDADRRKGSSRLVSHRPSEEERQRILLTCNQLEYASLPPGQIVPALADQGHYIGSESSFYRVLHQAGQCHRRQRGQCRASGLTARTSCGAGTSPICPPLFAVCGFTPTSSP
jgi:transposase